MIEINGNFFSLKEFSKPFVVYKKQGDMFEYVLALKKEKYHPIFHVIPGIEEDQVKIIDDEENWYKQLAPWSEGWKEIKDDEAASYLNNVSKALTDYFNLDSESEKVVKQYGLAMLIKKDKK